MSRWNASSRSRESPGNPSASVAATFSGNLSAPSDLGIVLPTYTFATPVFGSQATVGVLGSYGVVSTSLAGTLAARSACRGSAASRSRGSTASVDAVWGFGDLMPIASLRWNAGVNNYMVYLTATSQSALMTPCACRTSVLATARSTAAAAKLISIRRPDTNSQACSASPTISPISRRNIRTASTCISIGPRRSSSPSKSGWVWSAMSIKRSAATAAPATTSAASIVIPLSTTTQGYLNFKA